MNALDTGMELLKTRLAAAMVSRIVTRSLKDPGNRPNGELLQGVLTLLPAGESDFDNEVLGREAQLGTLDVKLVAHLQVANNTDPVAIEQAEGNLIDEVKAFCEAVPTDFDFVYLNKWRNSMQLDHPNGWVVFDLSVRFAS